MLKRLWTNNSLSIVVLGIFIACLLGMSYAGWLANNNELRDRQQPEQSYGTYVTDGTFIEGVFENWESEFLQMWALVMLTIWLRQKGAEDSKKLRGKSRQDTASRYKLRNAKDWPAFYRDIRHLLYSHSLGIALVLLFIMSLALHAYGGYQVYNEDAAYYQSSERVGFLSYITTSEFWYESLQNWQSEFLAVGVLILLSIKLRERGSPESKPVGVRYDTTTGTS